MRMSEVEKKSGHLALLRLGKSNQSLLRAMQKLIPNG